MEAEVDYQMDPEHFIQQYNNPVCLNVEVNEPQIIEQMVVDDDDDIIIISDGNFFLFFKRKDFF